MPYIVLDDQQAKVVAQAAGMVQIRDRKGRHLGYITQDIVEGGAAGQAAEGMQKPHYAAAESKARSRTSKSD
jgi:hypothetical protein